MEGVERRKRFGAFAAGFGAGAQGPEGPSGFARSLRLRLRLSLVRSLRLRRRYGDALAGVSERGKDDLHWVLIHPAAMYSATIHNLSCIFLKRHHFSDTCTWVQISIPTPWENHSFLLVSQRVGFGVLGF